MTIQEQTLRFAYSYCKPSFPIVMCYYHCDTNDIIPVLQALTELTPFEVSFNVCSAYVPIYSISRRAGSTALIWCLP